MGQTAVGQSAGTLLSFLSSLPPSLCDAGMLCLCFDNKKAFTLLLSFTLVLPVVIWYNVKLTLRSIIKT